MSAHNLRLPFATACLRQDLHHTDHCLRVIARLEQELHAEFVGLQFILPAILHVHHLAQHLGHLHSAGALPV